MCSRPTESDVTPDPALKPCTQVGDEMLTAEPSMKTPLPQHLTPPSEIAQICSGPEDIEDAVSACMGCCDGDKVGDMVGDLEGDFEGDFEGNLEGDVDGD